MVSGYRVWRFDHPGESGRAAVGLRGKWLLTIAWFTVIGLVVQAAPWLLVAAVMFLGAIFLIQYVRWRTGTPGSSNGDPISTDESGEVERLRRDRVVDGPAKGTHSHHTASAASWSPGALSQDELPGEVGSGSGTSDVRVYARR